MLIKREFGPDLNSCKLNKASLTHFSHSIFHLKRFRCLKEYEKKICTEMSTFFADFSSEFADSEFANFFERKIRKMIVIILCQFFLILF